jgi:2-phospho-L-lactate transferase/gluconeogenesis factor (CofD/UPF0052 family)
LTYREPFEEFAGLKVTALAGGVGGARLADGLAQTLEPEALTVIVNTGDDFEHLGLKICPDLDTIIYTLAGLSNPATVSCLAKPERARLLGELVADLVLPGNATGSEPERYATSLGQTFRIK